jgi:hypothetical protein
MKVNCQTVWVKEDRRTSQKSEVRMQNAEVRMQKSEYRSQNTEVGAIFTSAFLLLDSEFLYSYLSASTGSSLEARRAGISPLITPTSSNTSVETARVIREMCR